MIPLHQVAEIPSTSEALKAQAERGVPETALLAAIQTHGRGRLGSTWRSIPGNLNLSVLLRPNAPIQPGHWSLLAAVALARTIHAPPGRLRLKWPNDLLLEGCKLAGILLESGGNPPWLVLGFGVNLAGTPPDLGRPVAALTQLAPAIPPPHFARTLLTQLDQCRRTYETQGFPPIHAAWRALGPEPGDPITVRSPTGRLEGTFAGLAPNGALLLDQAGTIRTIVSGEVE